MNENDKYNCDIEIYNLSHAVKNTEDEACFYFRINRAGKLFLGYGGEEKSLVDGFFTAFENDSVLVDIVDAALELYFENEKSNTTTGKD